MPDDTQNQWPNPRPGDLPQTSANRPTPPPPPPEITLRTMGSDLDSIKETGGSGSAPKPFTPPEFNREFSRPAPPPPPQSRIAPASFSAPKQPEMPSSKTASIIEEETPKKTIPLKRILRWTGGLLIVGAIGFVGYSYIYPLLFPQQNPPLQKAPTVNEAPVVPLPTNTAQAPVVIPPAENQNPIATTTPTSAPTPQPHKSLLKSSDGASPEQLAAADLNSLQNALRKEAQKSLPSGNLIEIVLSDANGQIYGPAALSALLPEISSDTLKNIFEEDFTTALYYDTNGAWPAYIFKLKPESSQVEAQAALASLESSANLKNLFATDPGMPNASVFKTGQANGAPTRYLPYAQKGASLNFAWFKNKFVISASYGGLKKILGSL